MKHKILTIILASIVGTLSIQASDSPIVPPVEITNFGESFAKGLSVRPSQAMKIFHATKPIDVSEGWDPLMLFWDPDGFHSPSSKKGAIKRWPNLSLEIDKDVQIDRKESISAERFRGRYVMTIQPVPEVGRLALNVVSEDQTDPKKATRFFLRLLTLASKVKPKQHIPFVFLRNNEVIAVAGSNGNPDVVMEHIDLQHQLTKSLILPDMTPEQIASLRDKATQHIGFLKALHFLLMENPNLNLPGKSDLRQHFLSYLYDLMWDIIDSTKHLGYWDAQPFTQQTLDALSTSYIGFRNWLFGNVISSTTVRNEQGNTQINLTLNPFVHKNILTHMTNHWHFAEEEQGEEEQGEEDRPEEEDLIIERERPQHRKSYFVMARKDHSLAPYQILRTIFSPGTELYAQLSGGRLQAFVKLAQLPADGDITAMKCWNPNTGVYDDTNTFSFVVSKYGPMHGLNTMHPDKVPATLRPIPMDEGAPGLAIMPFDVFKGAARDLGMDVILALQLYVRGCIPGIPPFAQVRVCTQIKIHEITVP
jgi:hypothetical protein